MLRFEHALMFAAQAHSGQTRKNSVIPYIVHPMEVCSIAATITDDEDILIATLLHDTVEDTPVTSEDIRREFGERVAELVAGETEVELDDVPREVSWRFRKEDSLRQLKSAGRDVKIMWLSDKLSNLRSFCRLRRAEGDAMWNNFNCKDKLIQEWYYRAIAESLTELSGCEAYEELCSRIDELFGEE